MDREPARRALEAVFRAEYGSLLATLIRWSGGRFEAAEEALSDALTAALARWPSAGLPDRPAAWLLQVARRRLVDQLRHQPACRAGELPDVDDLVDRKEHGVVGYSEWPGGENDDRLRLIFTCCHPALAPDAQVALTLNTLCGLRASEIARAFLTSEATLAQRLVRAKRKIRQAGIPYRVPSPELLLERLCAVQRIIYLLFNEGYSAAAGDVLVRPDLCREAIRVARLCVELMPHQPENRGLLALLLLQHSRREARLDGAGELVLLEDQDRTLWDANQIQEGLAQLDEALLRRRPGPYQVQAAIAGLHARATRPADTDWRQIELLYDTLLGLEPSPVYALNRCVAVAMARGPEAGLEALEPLSAVLEDYLYLHATRADLLRRLGRYGAAREAYQRALGLAHNAPERRFLERRIAQLPSG